MPLKANGDDAAGREPPPPDAIIVRGCSVTAKAQRDCEKAIAHLRARFPTADIRARAEKEAVPRCGECGGLIKPRVVFFGESLDQDDLERAFRECAACDVLLVLGSSLTVTPVANLPMTAIGAGRKAVIVNAQPTPVDRYAALTFDDIAQFCTEMTRFFNLDQKQ